MSAQALPEVLLRDALMGKPYGIDCSHWESHIDWSIASQYVDFAIAKATEGTGFVDSEFQNNKSGCAANHVPFASYHFFLPQYDAVAQANHFVNTVGGDCAVYVLDLERALLKAVLAPPVESGTGWYSMDSEMGKEAINQYCGLAEYPPELMEAMDQIIFGDQWASGIMIASTQGLIDGVKSFLDRVEQLTNRIPWIYTSPGFWNQYMVPTPEWADYYRKWVAHWGVVEPTLPNGWTSYQIHQFSASGNIPGIPGAVDEDCFNGDLVDLWALFEFELEPPSEPIQIKTKVGLRYAYPILAEPKASASLIGYALPGKVWIAQPKIEGLDEYEYYQVGLSAYLLAQNCTEI